VSQLAIKYRPVTFGDVVGQRPATALLYLTAKKDDAVPGGMLFYGQWGSGKTTLARIMAKALNCEVRGGKASQWPCGSCPSCKAIDSETSPAVEEIDAASNGSVEQVRAIRQRAYSYGTAGGRYKVFILDEAHGLSAGAFEALLMLLEDPPPGVVFILVTTKPEAIPRTVRSRLSPFRFTPLPVAAVTGRLEHICRAEGFEAEPALLTAIAEASGGSVRDAVTRLDQVTSVGIGSLDLWRELTGETDFAPGLLAAAADGNEDVMYAAMEEALASAGDPAAVTRELTRCLADLLTLACGGPVTAQGAGLEARRELLGRIGKERASKAMAVLWDLMTRVRAEDRAAGLQVALAVLARHLGARPAAPIDRATGGEKPSLAELSNALEGA
jgi:DNA polymerase III subunit gamma/tau